MASPKPALIVAIRNTAKKLASSPQYQWGHMGSCNCGHLVQEVTQLSRADIHEYAMRTRGGDWSEQAMDYCPTSGYLMDQVISIMLEAGMDLVDFKHLERLSDKAVLARLPQGSRHLRHNYREDAVIYLNAWADLLEDRLLQQVELPSLEITPVAVEYAS
ncbi:MAG: hypothetical protein AAF944_17665 [Bacteroidota bacterium]